MEMKVMLTYWGLRQTKYFAVVEKHGTAGKPYCNAYADVTGSKFAFS